MRHITFVFAIALTWATSASADEVRVITAPAAGCCGLTVITFDHEEAKPAPTPPRKPGAVKKPGKAELGDCVVARDKAVADLATCTTARGKAETDLAALRATLKGCQDAGKLYDPVANACVDKPVPAGRTTAPRGRRVPAPAAAVPAGEDTEPFTTQSRAGGAQ